MKILIVDDDDKKIEKIDVVIREVLNSINHEILVAKNTANAMQILVRERKIDLLILDLNLPVRDKEAIKKLAGLKLLEEINRRNNVCKPESIIGLTAFKTEELKSIKPFKNEGWSIAHFSLRNSDWESIISNKLNYLVSKNSTISSNSSPKEVILFIASSPTDQSLLNAGLEQRKIEDTLISSTLRDKFDFISKQGAKLETLTREMMKLNPQYVHFTGHGATNGIAMEDDNGNTVFVPSAALIQLFELFKDTIKCVILSACYSHEQAQAISSFGINVIGMNASIGVDAATEFAKGFYQAVGEGKDALVAFKFGLIHLTTTDDKQKEIPEIWQNGVKII